MQSVRPRVEEKKVTGFTDTEEEAGCLTKVVPLFLQDELEAEGGWLSRGADLSPYVGPLASVVAPGWA